jgi:signal transduction histidine kinase
MLKQDQVNILLVDDQPAKLLSYEVVLGGLGENLIKAGSAREALVQLLRHEIAVILTDVSMPELDGFELAAMIREHPRFRETAIIFVSAIHMTEIDLLRGYQAGAVDYVPVPVVPELLRAKVRVFADLYRKTRQLERLNAELVERFRARMTELARANAELEQRVEERTREREVALAQVHEMQKMESLGQLTGGVAHDFNNLLMVVLGNLSLLRKRISPDLVRYVDGAIQGAERGATLTKRMLAFARRQELRPIAVDLPELVGGMMDMLRRTLGPAVDIHLESSAHLPRVRVDPNQFELALLNLALNARDAMPGGGRLNIRAAEAALPDGAGGLSGGDFVCITVADSGTGMDEATLGRATEPFFTTKGTGKGTGLGLSMVHGLAAQSGGTMRIDSRPGEGTTVRIWLPLDPSAEPKVEAVREPPAPASRSRRILVVDDDPLVLSSTAAMLDDLGHSVLEASSAPRALDVLRAGAMVDLVITDQAMPGMSGIDLIRKVRESWPDIPVILASGYAELPDSPDLPEARLAKPFHQQELAACIAIALGGDKVVRLSASRRA